MRVSDLPPGKEILPSRVHVFVAIIRPLTFKWIRIFWKCWMDKIDAISWRKI